MRLQKNGKPIQFIKYMGSKTKLLPNIMSTIEKIHTNGQICDLFSGSCSLSSILSNKFTIISNDIQAYSSVLANAYLLDWNDLGIKDSQKIIEIAKNYHKQNFQNIIKRFCHDDVSTIERFIEVEEANRQLINYNFKNSHHLFTKYYSGTWWSAEQCSWIDSLKYAIDSFSHTSIYNTLMSSLMFAMAYSSQGTGHYAQYRDATSQSSKEDILIYRNKNLISIFQKKADEAIVLLDNNRSKFQHKILTKDYKEVLAEIPQNATVYADPPYCFVHYSRFYHALETLVLYDYPKLQEIKGELVKGRYREGRHQSPFSIRSQVKKAFGFLFEGVALSSSNMVLSYSNSGMITIQELLDIAKSISSKYTVEIETIDYKHMTMGRKDDRSRDIKEALLSFYRSN